MIRLTPNILQLCRPRVLKNRIVTQNKPTI